MAIIKLLSRRARVRLFMLSSFQPPGCAGLSYRSPSCVPKRGARMMSMQFRPIRCWLTDAISSPGLSDLGGKVLT